MILSESVIPGVPITDCISSPEKFQPYAKYTIPMKKTKNRIQRALVINKARWNTITYYFSDILLSFFSIRILYYNISDKFFVQNEAFFRGDVFHHSTSSIAVKWRPGTYTTWSDTSMINKKIYTHYTVMFSP